MQRQQLGINAARCGESGAERGCGCGRERRRRVPSLQKRAQKGGRARIGVEQWDERVSERKRARDEHESTQAQGGRHGIRSTQTKICDPLPKPAGGRAAGRRLASASTKNY